MQRERLQSAQETNNESLEDVQEELGMHMQQIVKEEQEKNRNIMWLMAVI